MVNPAREIKFAYLPDTGYIAGARPIYACASGVACCGAGTSRGSNSFMAEHAASATDGWENKYHWVRRLPREWSGGLLRAWSPVPWRSTRFPSFSNPFQDSLLSSRSSHRPACPQPASVSCTVDSSLTTTIASQQTTSNHPVVCYRYPSYLKPWRRLPKHIISLQPLMSQTQRCRL